MVEKKVEVLSFAVKHSRGGGGVEESDESQVSNMVTLVDGGHGELGDSFRGCGCSAKTDMRPNFRPNKPLRRSFSRRTQKSLVLSVM